MTRQQIREAATKKGYQIEENEKFIGFTKGKGVWHWFRTYEDGDTAYCFFDHSYSQNTGYSNKNHKHGFKLKMSLSLA